MALMKFREPNQVKWQGLRPGHNGEQVLESGSNNAVVVNLVYTVPPGKILYLTYFFMGAGQAGNNVFTLHIYDTTPAIWRTLAYSAEHPGLSESHISEHFWPPVEVFAGYSIRVQATAALWYGWSIHGWVE